MTVWQAEGWHTVALRPLPHVSCIPMCVGLVPVSKWIADSTLIEPRSGFTLVAVGSGAVLLIGGEINGIATGTCLRSSDGGLHWDTLSVECAQPVGAASVQLHTGEVVVVGGNATSQVWRSPASPAGQMWVLDAGTPPWAARSMHALALLADGTLLMAGGRAVGDDASLNDVWRSLDGGVTWTVMTESAEWQPRTGASLFELPDSSIIVLGGTDGETVFADVWKSVDGGASFVELAPPTWSSGSLSRATAINGVVYSVVLEPPFARVYRSPDGCQTWTTVAYHLWSHPLLTNVVAVSSTKLLLVGRDSDTWMLVEPPALNTTWHEDRCSNLKRALCTAPVGTFPVSVSLPAHAGTVSPANGATAMPASALYRPPLPVLSLATGQASPVANNVVDIDVTFSSPVAALRATDFSIVFRGAIVARELLGSERTWSLHVQLAAAGVPSVCPAGFTLATGGGACSRAIEQLGTWDEQAANCLPFSLAAGGDGALSAVVTGAAQWSATQYWCVGTSEVHGCTHLIVGLCVPHRIGLRRSGSSYYWEGSHEVAEDPLWAENEPWAECAAAARVAST